MSKVWSITIVFVVAIVLLCVGAWAGYSVGVKHFGGIIGGLNKELGQYRSDLESAREFVGAIGTGITDAQNNIRDSSRGLETSLISISRLGSYQAQSRELFKTIRGYLTEVRKAIETLQSIDAGQLGDVSNIIRDSDL